MITPQILKSLPTTFGIYQYLDKDGKILYVGKAKNIKKRIKSYFIINEDQVLPNPSMSQRIQLMLAQAMQIHTIIVSSEQDALLLENTLIKQLKPKYNILLRDDKTYPYICINLNEDFPRFEMTRKLIHSQAIKYFGPYPSGCRDLLDSLYSLLPLVQKKSCLRAKKACLFYQIQKCPAPCQNQITKEEYQKTIDTALHLLHHKNKLQDALKEKMQDLAQKLLFEEANLYKMRIQKITPLANFSQIMHHKPYTFDIFCILKENDKKIHQAILLKLFMRDGQIIASDSKYIQSDYEIDIQSLYTQFILHHYKTPLPIVPQAILLDSILENKEELQDFIATHQNKKIPIEYPQRGFKLQLVEIAMKNASELMRQQNERHPLLHELKHLLHLSQTPYRIEVFDTSHHGFDFNVGGMVVFEHDIFIKDSYRHYHLEGKDEYSQMQEMLTRRIQSFQKDPPPNLWLLDGGRAQINLAIKLLNSAGISLDVIAIAKEKLDHKAHRAKGRAKDSIYTQEHILTLNPHHQALQFLQKLRDEAHRYAISFHRKQKTKGLLKNTTPYSPAQLKKLLDYYGDFHHLQKASTQEIKQILKSTQSKKLLT